MSTTEQRLAAAGRLGWKSAASVERLNRAMSGVGEHISRDEDIKAAEVMVTSVLPTLIDAERNVPRRGPDASLEDPGGQRPGWQAT